MLDVTDVGHSIVSREGLDIFNPFQFKFHSRAFGKAKSLYLNSLSVRLFFLTLSHLSSVCYKICNPGHIFSFVGPDICFTCFNPSHASQYIEYMQTEHCHNGSKRKRKRSDSVLSKKAPTLTEKSKKQRVNTKTPPKT